MNSDPHRWQRVLPPMLLCAAMWGNAFPCIKWVYQDWAERGVHVGLAEYWWLAGLRFTLAGAALLLVAKHPFQQARRTDKRLLLGFALTQTFGQYLLFYYAMAIASGALAGLLSSIGSFWWMVLAPLLTPIPWPTGKQWLALCVGALGVTLAAAAPGAGSGNPWLGTLLLAGATGFGALGIIQFGKMQSTITARAATGFSLLIGGAGLLLCGAPAFARMSELLNGKVVGLTLWLAFVSAFAFSLWNSTSTKHPVPLLASYRFLIPVMGVLESIVLLGDKPGWGLIAGAPLVIGGLIAAQRNAVR